MQQVQFAHGVMCHHFHNEQHPQSQGSISAIEFERLLQHLGAERMLSPAEWLAKLATNALEPDDICLTFDDGLRCQFDVALPVLERYGVTAFWFIYSSVFEGQVGKLEVYRFFRTVCFPDVEAFYERFFENVFGSPWAQRAAMVLTEGEISVWQTWYPFYSVNDIKFRLIRDRALPRAAYEQLMDGMMQARGVTAEELAKDLWMSNDQLRALTAQGHMVGLHSYSHPTVLAALPLEEQAEEYQRNCDHITQVCGQRPLAVAHPCNSYRDETMTILQRLGIRCGFRSNMFATQHGGRVNHAPLELAREDHANLMRGLAW